MTRRLRYATKVAGFCQAYGMTANQFATLATRLDAAARRIKSYEANRTVGRKARMQSEAIGAFRTAGQLGLAVTWNHTHGVHDGAFRLEFNGIGIPFPTY